MNTKKLFSVLLISALLMCPVAQTEEKIEQQVELNGNAIIDGITEEIPTDIDSITVGDVEQSKPETEVCLKSLTIL